MRGFAQLIVAGHYTRQRPANYRRDDPPLAFLALVLIFEDFSNSYPDRNKNQKYFED